MSINRVIISGKVTDAGPKLAYLANGRPECRLPLIVEETGKEAQQQFPLFVPVYVYGDRAEQVTADGKKVWLIREPKGAHQWTFLIGTNWADFPEFSKHGIYHVNSPRGNVIADRIFYTADEQRARGLLA